MKFNRIHINSFGKLKNRTLEFSDGIHVIQGPNESGKSTLHAFLEAMLFGMERSRGRGAKSDSYTRYFPEEGGSTYGGVLEFTQDDTLYSVYRNFRRNPTGLTLMDETHGKQIAPDPEEYRAIISGLSLPLYRNTVSLRQLKAKTSDELPELLKNHIVNLRQAGSASIDLTKTKNRLLRDKRALMMACDADAEKNASLLELKIREEETVISSLPDPAELPAKKEEAAEMNEALLSDTAARRELLSGIHDCEKRVTENEEQLRAEKARMRVFAGICLVFAAAAALLFFQKYTIPAACLLAACAAALILALVTSGKVKRLAGETDLKTQLTDLRRREEALTTGILNRQQQLKGIERAISELNRDLFKREESEERKRTAEIELEALRPVLEKNRSVRAECEAIDLALKTIEDLSGNVFDSFGKYLTDTASELISQITGGRYTKLLMDDRMELSLVKDDQPVPIASVSVSTIDQVYLALRIACIEFFWPEESMPLLLDESFAMYDEARITETLTWLAESYPGQIFLFSAQSREENVLSSCRIKHHLISL